MEIQIDRRHIESAQHALLGFHRFTKLGKRAPRHDKRTLKFRDYARGAALAPPPAACSWTTKIALWPMLANDRLGDCTCAGAGHMVECWTGNAKTLFMPTDAEAISMYEAVGGYVPGNNSTDNGADEVTVLNYWRQTGFANHKIEAYVSVDAANAIEVRQAIQLFGGVYIGLAMPMAWQGETIWDAPSSGVLARLYRALVKDSDWTAGSWGGHAVPLLAYDNNGYTPITWGSASYRITNAGLATYCDEMYACVSEDFIATNGLDPSGFDLAQLMVDLQGVSDQNAAAKGANHK